MTAVYGGGGGAHGSTSQTQLHLGRSTPPNFVPQTWETSQYEAFDLSIEPPGSPPKPGPDSYRRADSSPQPDSTKTFVSGMAKAKARPRGESDLGRPAAKLNTRANGSGANGHGFPILHENGSVTPVSPRSSFAALPESLSTLLLPLPYLLSWLAYEASRHGAQTSWGLPFGSDAAQQARSRNHPPARSVDSLSFANACMSTALGLTFAGAYQLQQLRRPNTVLDKRKPGLTPTKRSDQGRHDIWTGGSAMRVVRTVLGLLLSFVATAQIGGPRTALLLVLTANELSNVLSHKSAKAAQMTPFTLAVIALCLISDLVGLTSNRPLSTILTGYLALAVPVIFQLAPLTSQAFVKPGLTSKTSTSAVPSTPIDTPTSPKSTWPLGTATVVPVLDAQLMLAAGVSLAALTAASTILGLVVVPFSQIQVASLVLSALASVGLMQAGPFPIRREARITGTIIGSGFITIFALTNLLLTREASPRWAGLFSTLLPLLGCLAVFADNPQPESQAKQPIGQPSSYNPSSQRESSVVTTYILSLLTPGSLLHSIMSEKDSRRIAYFACLNLGFMLVQFVYGFLSGSLGLLTDSIHMLFDCAGLAVGLAAAVMSKWPPSFNFPYGYGKIDTLSGFANGIFLILVSVEIVFDAVHRLGEGHELRRLNELLVVSILGFLVNIVGLTAFGHAHHHHGHDHDHSHGGAHNHDHGHSDFHGSHQNDAMVPTTPLSATTPAASPDASSHHHHHHQENENMQGIFLHILADALGSLSVIISTLLTQYTGWHGWDPIASCIISFLIFFSAVPLVKGAGMKLLLALPDELEYSVRDALGELGSLRGVIGYQVPKFWLAENGSKGHDHDHDHNHSHSHDHPHGHGHGHSHGHSTKQHEHSDRFAQHSHHDHSLEHEDHHEKHHATHAPMRQRVMGIVHVTAGQTADVEDVRERVGQLLKGRGIDAIIQVDREGEGRCWCSAGVKFG